MKKAKHFVRNTVSSRTARLSALGMALTIQASQAIAQSFELPMSDFFCKVATAMQSQWAPGIILICIIVETFLFLVVKKGILQILMVSVLAATLALGAGKFLNMISPGAGCFAAALS